MFSLLDRNERKFRSMAKLARELKLPYIEAWLDIEVLDEQGKVIHHHRQRSRSWTRNAYNIIISNLGNMNLVDATFAAGKISLRNTGGSIYSSAYGCGMGSRSCLTSDEAYNGSAGGVTAGVIAGSGTGDESFEDYVIGTIIANGTGAGNLSYAADEVQSYAYDTPSKTLTVTHRRYMNNNSSGDVGVKEVALYNHCQYGSSGQLSTFCVSRDKLGATITIPATGQLRVTYTIALVYPA